MKSKFGSRTLEQLEELLPRVLILNQEKRLKALLEVLDWHESVAPFIRTNFTTLQESKFQRLKRYRVMLTSPEINEKETAILACIRTHEVLLQPYAEPFSKLDTYISQLSARSADLASIEAALEERFRGLLKGIQGVFATYGVTFKIDPESEQPRSFTANRQVTLSVDYAEKLLRTLADFGIFAVCLGEIMPLVCRVLSIKDEAGKKYLDANLMKENLEALSYQMVRFVHANHQMISNACVALPKDPPPPEDIAALNNKYFRGNYATVFETLWKHRFVQVSRLKSEIKAQDGKLPDIFEILGALAAKGEETGEWTIKSFESGYVQFATQNRKG